MRKRLVAIALAAIASLLIATPALAYLYRIPYTIKEANDNAYSMLALTKAIDNSYLSDSGFIKASALDTRVETLAGLAKPHMVAEDRTLTAVPVPALSQVNMQYTTGNTDLSAMDIITGYNGYVTLPDAAGLEWGNNGQIIVDGYVDTATAGSIVTKNGAYGLASDGSGNVTAGLYTIDAIDVTPVAFAAWTDVDISAYIPSTAVGVMIELYANAKDAGFRKNGSADNRIIDGHHWWAAVGVDGSQIFETYLQDNTCYIYLVGYFTAPWVFNTNADDVSLAAGFGAWTDIDITAITSANTIGAIVEVYSNVGALRAAGVRKNGSVDARNGDMAWNSHYWAFVGVDDNEIFEMWAQDALVDCFVIGYVESGSGATFNTDAVDKSIGAVAWTEIDCSVQAPSAIALIFEVYDTVGGMQTYGFRQVGSTDARLQMTNRYHAYVVMPCNSSQKVEGYVAAATVDFFLTGYITANTGSATVASLSAAATAGEHLITSYLTGGTFSLRIDTDAPVTVAYAGTVAATATDWIIGSNVAPYLTSYKHYVGGALVTRYEPNTMIIGTTLPDREVAANDGVITWGANPAGVTVTLGGMVSASQPSAGETAVAATQDIMPSVEVTDWFVEPDVTGALLTNPLRPFVTMMSDTTSITELQAWRLLGLAMVLLATALTGAKTRGHLAIICFVAGSVILGLAILTIWPKWAAIAAIGCFIGGLVAERSPNL